MTESESIFQWMEKNKDIFKAQGICKKVGIDKGNFSKYKSQKSIPQKYIIPIFDVIVPLGYKLEENKKRPEDKKSNESSENENMPNSTWIEEQITAIENEKIPPERNTLLGKRVWENEQRKRISELRNQFK